MGELGTTIFLITPMEFTLGVISTVASAALIGVGKLVWDLTGEVRELRIVLKNVKEDMDELKALVEQGRKWRWDSGLGGPTERRT